jgi:hypothetical protein
MSEHGGKRRPSSSRRDSGKRVRENVREHREKVLKQVLNDLSFTISIFLLSSGEQGSATKGEGCQAKHLHS